MEIVNPMVPPASRSSAGNQSPGPMSAILPVETTPIAVKTARSRFFIPWPSARAPRNGAKKALRNSEADAE